LNETGSDEGDGWFGLPEEGEEESIDGIVISF